MLYKNYKHHFTHHSILIKMVASSNKYDKTSHPQEVLKKQKNFFIIFAYTAG